MDKKQVVSEIQKATEIPDISARVKRIQDILDSFESFLRTSWQSCNNHTTHCNEITDNDPARAGGQRAIPENILPEVRQLANHMSYRQISNTLAENYGLSVHRTTVCRAVNGRGIYARANV